MAVSCKKCGGPHPTWDCTASAAKISAYQNRGGSSAVEPRPSKPLVEGSTPSPRSKNTPRGSGTARKAPGGSAPRKSIAEPERAPGISSEVKPATDLLPVRATQQGTQSAPAKSKRKDTRKGDRHKTGYWSTYQRKDRLKAAKEAK